MNDKNKNLAQNYKAASIKVLKVLEGIADALGKESS